MKMLESVLREDVLKVLNSKAPSTGSFLLEAECKTKAGLPIKITRIYELLLTRDYAHNIGDDIVLVCEVSRATYEHLLYPNRADIRISLTKTPCDKNGDNPKLPETSDYRAILTDPVDNTFNTASMGGDTLKDKEMDNYPIALQLVDIELEDALEIELSGVLYEADVHETIETLVSNFGQFGISVHPVDNDGIKDQIVLEQGLPILEFANWLQSKSIGVYNYGCNTYFISGKSIGAKPAGNIPGKSVYNAPGWIYVYPPLLLGNHEYRKRHIIYRCASDELVGVENTYRVEDEVAHLVITGDVEFVDTTEKREREMGNVIVYDSEPNYLDGRVIHDNGTTTFDNTTWTHVADKNRRVNHVKTYHRQTSNIYRENSRISESLGKFIEVTWENPNSIIFPPNTEVELYYVNVDKLYKLEGVVVGYKQVSKEIPIKGSRSVFRPIANLRIRVSEITEDNIVS